VGGSAGGLGPGAPSRYQPSTSSTVAFWSAGQPGFRFTDAEPGSERFYREVETQRYALEPHIPALARFHDWAGKDVLDVGCGIATDGARFARAGARYVGLDQSPAALELGQRLFKLKRLDGTFLEGDATQLPFADESFDLVWSHGVIHHIPDSQRVISEFYRVLRPQGTAIVMVYHRGSLNYRFNILVVRRVLAAALAVPGALSLLQRALPVDTDLLTAHRELLRMHGRRYLTDTSLFLSNNTDGPGNPLSKVYSRNEVCRMFRTVGFADVETDVRYLNLRLYPKGDQLAATALARRLEPHIGWHLYVRAVRKRLT
jgi:SAM-dependent methyltransferase